MAHSPHPFSAERYDLGSLARFAPAAAHAAGSSLAQVPAARPSTTAERSFVEEPPHPAVHRAHGSKAPGPGAQDTKDIGAAPTAVSPTGAIVTLVPFPAAEAQRIAEALAAIDPWKSYPYPASELARYFASGSATAPVFAILVGAAIAGVVGLRLDWLRGPYLQFFGILPAQQRFGLGARVLAWMEREAGPSTRNLWLCASDFNADAIRFYERHGFERIAILDGLVQDDRNEVLMRKRLAAAAS